MPNMFRTNLTVSVTVYSADGSTVVPQNYMPLSSETTHLVDLIEISKGDSSVKQIICLEGIYNSGRFIFTDKAVNRLAAMFNKAFKNSQEMLQLLQKVVAINISSNI